MSDDLVWEKITIGHEEVPIEIYTKERIAEFLLTSTMDMEEYAEVVEGVKAMGLDPESIPHKKPEGE